MLHCPRCSSALLVQDVLPHHCPPGPPGPPGPPPKAPPPCLPRPLYQNVGPPVPPRVPPHPPPGPAPAMVAPPSPALLLLQKDAKLQVELATLHMAIAEKQLEQSRLQQELLQQAGPHLPTPSPLPGLLPSPWFSPPGPRLPPARPAAELEASLARSAAELSQTAWYYGRLTWQESAHLLEDSQQGTFLVRDSCSPDPSFRYSLSVQRRREDVWAGGRLLRAEGPTSVRIQFVNGEWRLDADGKIRDLMPLFPSVCSLVAHYLSLSARRGCGRREVLIEQEEEEEAASRRGLVSGLLLARPLLRAPPALDHLARLAIHRAAGGRAMVEKDRQQLQLPGKLLDYLDSYPLAI